MDDLGLEQLGVEITRRGITVDARLRAAENVWAIGDVTGVAAFTHVGKYQARIAATDVAGEETEADYTAIPRVTFTDPQVAAVGSSGGEGLVESEWRVERTSRRRPTSARSAPASSASSPTRPKACSAAPSRSARRRGSGSASSRSQSAPASR